MPSTWLAPLIRVKPPKAPIPLIDNRFLTVTAIIAGCEGWKEIEDFGHARLDWLKRYGNYESVIPIHNTIARVVNRINPEALHSSFIQWMTDTETHTGRQVIAVDGTTFRGSYRPGDRQAAMVINYLDS